MVCAVLLTAGGVFAADDKLAGLIKSFENASDGKVLVAAHRGDHKRHPENSIPGLVSAAALGADIVELDVRKCGDGRLVLMHDPKIDRTTTGKGKVSELTFEEIRRHYLKYSDGRVSSEKVPSLEEALEALRGKCLINLDRSEFCLEECLALVRENGMERQIIVKGSKDLDWAKEVLDKSGTRAYYGPIVFCKDTADNERSFQEYVKGVELLRPEMVEIVIYQEDSSLISAGARALADKYDVRIWCNSLFDDHGAGHVDSKALVDPDGNWGWLVEQGVDIIQTDEIEALLAYLRSRNLHD